MKPHLLIAVDAFTDAQIASITAPISDWATWERTAEDDEDAYRARLAASDIVIGWVEPEWLVGSPVKLVLCPSVGYEQYLGKGLEAITFCNASGIYSEGIAELCLGMMLSLTKRLPQYVRRMQTHTWQQYPGHDEIAGKTVCIVGLGSIGMAIARRCASFSMKVIGVRRGSSNPDTAIVQQVYPPRQLAEAVAGADHIVVALPGGRGTRGLFDGSVFEAMKTGAYFYNVGRGSAVDETALVAALQRGQITGAGMDVFAEEPLPADSPLWAMENVIVTPHMAGYTPDYADRLGALFAENLRRYRDHQPLLNVINLAEQNA